MTPRVIMPNPAKDSLEEVSPLVADLLSTRFSKKGRNPILFPDVLLDR